MCCVQLRIPNDFITKKNGSQTFNLFSPRGGLKARFCTIIVFASHWSCNLKKLTHTHSFHWITSGDISIDIHETFMKYKELSESYYFQMLFLHSDPISILSPGFVELPDPSLQKQMHLQWPDDFSSFWRWKPNAPSPGLRQRHAWTFRNSRSAKPDLKCPGRIWHFMILDSCLSVQSQPFGDFRNHLFKKT